METIDLAGLAAGFGSGVPHVDGLRVGSGDPEVKPIAGLGSFHGVEGFGEVESGVTENDFKIWFYRGREVNQHGVGKRCGDTESWTELLDGPADDFRRLGSVERGVPCVEIGGFEIGRILARDDLNRLSGHKDDNPDRISRLLMDTVGPTEHRYKGRVAIWSRAFVTPRPMFSAIGPFTYTAVVPWERDEPRQDALGWVDLGWVDEVTDLVSDLRSLGPLPYDPTPGALYAWSDLYSGFDDGGFAATADQVIYVRARRAGGRPIGPTEALAQRLHDHGITLALDRFRATRRLVGVMGGHALGRDSVGYRQAVALGRAITVSGRCVVTGGGPGAMEAANLGAATAGLSEDETGELVQRLAVAPDFTNDPDGFVGAALDVVGRIEAASVSLSVPTWFYGHEPTNPFATHIAKYFSNSEREDGLLAIALSGIVFLAGGPGTMQEVFQDAAQNAYRTFGAPAPMVFLDPPDRPGFWVDGGIMAALHTTFTTDDGQRRPGWNLLAEAQTVDGAIERLR